MSVVMRMHWPAVTAEEYDRTGDLVDWEGDPPAGAELHVARLDDGLRVWGVWESAESFQAFVEGRLMPGVAQIGIDGQPSVTITPCHAHQVEAAGSAGAVLDVLAIPREGYDALAAKVGWAERPPAGGIAHIATFDEDGMVHALSVWESADALPAFVADRLAPAVTELGLPAPEPGPLHRLHRLFHFASARRPVEA